ncbi:trypsin-like serine protease [Niveispirillum sp. SYP-B3756]|uniref:trypsin-like serine peptidase n=1 Tax=Niveispirillum sp. SYP-B3756 TaxID=2662178 RepID=UPI001566406F|nr:trypsin-like serine protease [Niveispirillum sp. SYP-B3756]
MRAGKRCGLLCPAAFLVLLLLLFSWRPALAGADAPPLRAPGVAADDARRIVDINSPPWDAVARVQTNIGSRCTGTLVAPRLVLTAAHCLYNHRTRRLLQPVSLHVLFGYALGEYRTHLTVESVQVGAGYDGTRPGASLGHDWALLRLSGDAGVRPLPWQGTPPTAGQAVAVAGFSQDRTHLLMVDRDCPLREMRETDAGRLLIHGCSASRGTSGGPVLLHLGGVWQVVGLNIAAGATANIGLWHPAIQAAIAGRSPAAVAP